MKLIAAVIMAGMIWSAAAIWSGLPDINNINDLKLISATQVYDIHGVLIAKLFEQNRLVVSAADMSPYLAQAIVANEDTRFYSHMGVDPIGIARALLANLRAGGIAEGGSTITQQLAREMFLNQERTMTRKLREAILAVVLELRFTKAEILEAYLNQVYLGEGAYGVEAAAQRYFGKAARDLDLAESAMIAGLARGPALYSPYNDRDAAWQRRATVLAGMSRQGYIDEQAKYRAQNEPLNVVARRERPVKASYFMDYIANRLTDLYGADTVYTRGLKVYTTLDLKVQEAAEQVLGERQGAIVALDPRNGHIRAMVGGNDYQRSQRNRAVEELRQPGSAFKPFVYAQALNEGYRSNSVFVDEPVDIAGYKPQNYDKKHKGKMTLKKALRWSVNTVAVKLGQAVGMSDVLELAKGMGITTLDEGDNNLAAALGGLTDGVSLLELSAAYTGFAGGGVVVKPLAILRVENEHGQALNTYEPQQVEALSPEVSYIMTDMLMGCIQGGTAMAADIGREAAGKTGTTDGYETAWFIGYTPQLLAGIYIGNDDRTGVDLSGTQVAGLWGGFMKQALSDEPELAFPVPDNIVKGVKICAKTGQLAERGCDDVEYNAFIKGTEPKTALDKVKDKLLPDSGKGDRSKGGVWDWWRKIPGLLSF